ncbi:hypothetical protein V6N13_046034 [Hibiscus sabdariffa]|uniref:Uncharacterized protein n=2 Tax=Hibiscus sabdariffa TaxID=183260 RepID=A0ABR2AWJ8_9ROSI
MWDEVSSFVLSYQGQGLIPFPTQPLPFPLVKGRASCKSLTSGRIRIFRSDQDKLCDFELSVILHCLSLSFPFLNSSFARFELSKLLLKWRVN